MGKIGFILAILLLSQVATATAEPSDTVKYLMHEPVTMLDYGIHLIGKSIHSENGFAVGAHYDWDQNRIIISRNKYLVGEINTQDRESLKVQCKDIIKKTREYLAIDSSTGKPVLNFKNSSVANYFTHEGYANKNQPESLGEEIDKITVLTSTVWWTNPDIGSLSCRGPLVGTEIFCDDNDKK